MRGQANGSYQVIYLLRARQQMIELAQRADTPGVRAAYVAALRRIQQRLLNDPLGWGDPDYHLHHLGLRMCHGSLWGMSVYFGVDESRRIVYVREFRLLPGHPLGPEP
jgi:hypothetical protein